MTIRTEIYDGAKMFDLSGVVNGKYPKHEVKRLSLYISRTKFRPLVWRNTHPYVMCDRVEDVTSQQGLMQQQDEGGGQVADRDVMLYGYVRGTHLRQQQRVHLIGVGDFDIAAVTSLEDPCHQPGGAATPAPTTSGSSKASSKNVLTSLKKKDNLLYAPMANVGRVKIDSDGVYIELKQVHYTKTEHLLLGSQDNTHHQSAINDNAMGTTIGNTPADLLRQMQDTGDQHHHPHRHGQGGGHGGMHDAEMSLFAGSTAVKSSSHQQQQQQQLVKDAYNDDDDEEEDNENDDDDDDEEEDEEEEEEEDDDDDDDDDDEDGEEDDAGHASSGRTKQHIAANTDDTRWKEGMLEKAAAAYVDRSSNRSSVGRHGSAGGSSSVDVMRHVYGNAWSLPGSSSSSDGQGKGEDESDEDDDDDDLFVAVKASVLNNYRNNNCPDCNRHIFTTLASSSSSSLRSDVSSSSSSGIIAKAAAPTGGDYFSVLRIRFVTGGAKAWGNNSKKGRGTSPGDDESDDGDVNGDNDDDDDDEVYDDFEDLTETNNSGTQGQQQRSRSGHDDDEEEDDEEGEEEDDDDDSASEDSEAANEKLDEQLRQAYAKKKGQAKASFDADYDQRRDKRLGKVSEGVREKNTAITCRCLVYYYMSCID